MTKALFISFFLIGLQPSIAAAHPGNTAADGCHYCRTNCDKWGEEWDERHCHGTEDHEDYNDFFEQLNIDSPPPKRIQAPAPKPFVEENPIEIIEEAPAAETFTLTPEQIERERELMANPPIENMDDSSEDGSGIGNVIITAGVAGGGYWFYQKRKKGKHL